MPDETDRVTVSTYVPAKQRDRWREDAETLGMSQSEFVSAMVQAGRRGFSLGEPSGNPDQPDPSGSSPQGDGLKTAILGILQSEGGLGWAELVEELTGDLEDDVEAALIELQEEDRIHHSPREGSYSIAGALDGE